MSQRKNERVISALLESKSITEAARLVKLSRKTVERMLADPDFQRQLREARARAFGMAMSRLCHYANKAVGVLVDALDGVEIGKTRFLAACRVLEFANQVRTDDVQARVDEIEQQLRTLAEPLQ
jgi:hypothetical protein